MFLRPRTKTSGSHLPTGRHVQRVCVAVRPLTAAGATLRPAGSGRAAGIVRRQHPHHAPKRCHRLLPRYRGPPHPRSVSGAARRGAPALLATPA